MEKINQIMEEIKEDIISFAKDVVNTKSMTCEEEAMAYLVKEKMESLGFDSVIIDETGNVIGQIGEGERTLLFDSHMDTVAVIDESEWKHHPFEATIEDGKLYGRGAVDMKCGLVASIYGAYIAKRLGINNDAKIIVSASTMEEDFDGEALRQMLARKTVTPDCVVICEPTNLQISLGHRGRALIEVHSVGKACHASTPEKGENPVYELNKIVDRVIKLDKSLSLKEGEHGSVALSNVYCNTASNNSVPADATIILDRRLALGEDEAAISKEMDELISGTKATWSFCDIPGTDWKGGDFIFHSFLPAWDISKEDALIKLSATSYKKLKGCEPTYFRMIACTNGVTSAGVFDIPSVVFGPGDLALAHARDEYCDLESFLDACKIYADMCINF